MTRDKLLRQHMRVLLIYVATALPYEHFEHADFEEMLFKTYSNLLTFKLK